MVNPIEEGNKVRAEIISILLKDQIRYFKEQNRWPKEFDEDNLEARPTENNNTKEDDSADEDANSDSDLDDDLVPNTNRVYFESSEEEGDSGEEDEEVHKQNDQHDKKKTET